MNKRIVLICAIICAMTGYNISADLIGDALNLARGAVDTAANVSEGAIDVVDDSTYPARRYGAYPFGHHHYWHDTDEDDLEDNVEIEKTITKKDGETTIVKRIKRL